MNELPGIMLSNLLVASLIAVPALAAARWSRRPALVHGLWLLFFLKLITPPIFPIEIGWSFGAAAEAQVKDSGRERLLAADGSGNAAVKPTHDDNQEGLEPLPAPAAARTPEAVVAEFHPEEVVTPVTTAPTTEAPVDAGGGFAFVSLESFPWTSTFLGAWLAGAVCWFGLAVIRLLRFRKELRHCHPAPPALQEEAGYLAARLEVNCPEVCVLPGRLSPMLWVLGMTPRLLVPAGLLERLDGQQRQALLVHELAHWRRRDHWVRWLELAALGLYWWCPLVWRARRQLQEAEEECCDAWVVWLMPGAARGYALALVETLDFMANARIALPPVASGIGHVRLLQRRLTMIMRGTTPRTLTWGGGLAVLGLAALLLPLMPSWGQTPRPSALPEDRDGGDWVQVQAPRPGFTAQVEANQPANQPQGDPFAEKRNELDKAMRDIQRLQADLDRARADLERRSQEIRQRSEELRQMMDRFKQAPTGTTPEVPKPPLPVERKGKGTKEGGGFGGFPGATPGAPGAGNFGGGGFSGGGGGGFSGGGGGFGGGGFGGGGAPLADMDKRLREVERKIDMLIQMMMKSGGGRTGAPGGAGETPRGAPAPAGALYPPLPPQPAPIGVPGNRAPQGLVPATPSEAIQPPAAPQSAPTRRATPEAQNNVPVTPQTR